MAAWLEGGFDQLLGLVVKDAAQDGDRGRIGRFDAAVAQAARAQILSVFHRFVRGIMQETDIEMGRLQIDDFVDRMPLRAKRLVDGGEIGSAFHFDDGVTFFVKDAHVVGILQEGAEHSNRFLVVQDVAMPHVGAHVAGGEAVADEVGILRVFIVNHIGNHHIADAPVEGGGLAHDVYPVQASGAG